MGEEPLLLGVLYAALGAFTFALNNVAMRRGVVTGSVLQGMAMTVPIGGLSFLVMTVAFGEPDYLGTVRPDELRFADVTGGLALVTREHVVYDAAAA